MQPWLSAMCGLLKSRNFRGVQTADLDFDSGRFKAVQRAEHCAGGEERSRDCGMTAVTIVKYGVVMSVHENPPRDACGNHRRADLLADLGISGGDERLSLCRVPAGPGHEEGGLRPGFPDGGVEQPDVVMHARRVFDRQRALLLEDDEVISAGADFPEGIALVPVPAKRRAARADQAMLQLPGACLGQLRDKAGEIVSRGEAVSDEEDLQRGGTFLRPASCSVHGYFQRRRLQRTLTINNSKGAFH
jgi:hypothetical protein